MTRLEAHLQAWLGRWPPHRELEVTGSPARTRPGWDGAVRPLLGVGAPGIGTVLSVDPDHAAAVAHLLDGHGLGDDDARRQVADLLGGGTVASGVFRTAATVPDRRALPDLGTWVGADDPRVPAWLRPFNGGVLLLLDDDGAYAAGVGVKRHDDVGHELSVGTEPDHRGRGLAQRLVATAARDLLARGAVVTYLHDPANTASARVADAAGFPDRGWRVWGLFRDDDA